MKKQRSAARFAALCIGVSGLCIGAALAAPALSDKVRLRIEHVENGLRGPVAIKGQPLAKLTLTERMRTLNVPGVSIAVINNGAVEWARAYGVADAVSGQAVTTETLFQSASISKPVSTMGALALVQSGKLDLDGDVNSRLTSWKIPASEFTKDKPVSLRALLSHTAGMTVPGFRGYASDEPAPTVQQILDGQAPANSAPVRVAAIPGTKWGYSGGGITVAQLLVTETAAMPYADFMKKTVLDPLGMRHSTFDQPLSAAWRQRAATGHDAQAAPVKGNAFTYPHMAAAGLWTTPSDLARFAIELQQSHAGKSNKVLSQAMTADMLTPVLNGYGLGTQLDHAGAAQRFSHTGSNQGFRAILVAYTTGGQGAVVLTNSDSGMALIDELLRSIAAEYGWPDYQVVERTLGVADPKNYPQYAGEFTYAGTKHTVSTEGSRLFIAAGWMGPKPIELLPQSGDSYFALERDMTVAFKRNADGAVNEAQMHSGSAPPRTGTRTK